MDDQTSPRVNGTLLRFYQNYKNVRLVFRKISVGPDYIMGEASDGKTVKIVPHPSDRANTSTFLGAYAEGEIFECVGSVLDDLSLGHRHVTPFNSDFDLKNYDKAVMLGHEHFRKLILPV